MSFLIDCWVSNFSVAVIKFYDQKQLKEDFIVSYTSRRIVSIMAGKPWQLEQEADWSHFTSTCWRGGRERRKKERGEREQEMGQGYKPWKPTHCDTHSPARLYIPRFCSLPTHPTPPTVPSAAGDQVIKCMRLWGEISLLNHSNHHRR